jgi:hypothetical protein
VLDGFGPALVVGAAVAVAASLGVVVLGRVHVPEISKYPPPASTPTVGKSWSVSVHQGVYGTAASHEIVVVDATVAVVPVTEQAVMVWVHVVLPQPLSVVVMKSVTEQKTSHIVTVVLVAHVSVFVGAAKR